jgi:hypothetical protein
MITPEIIRQCRAFVDDPQTQRYNITMDLKRSLGRDNRFEEVGHRLGQFKPFIDYFYDRMIDMYPSEARFYEHCAISRQLFSNMQRNDYDPSITTVYKIAIGLELDLLETVILGENAGYTFTYKTVNQRVILFCVLNRLYDPMEVDELLVAMDCLPLFSI